MDSKLVWSESYGCYRLAIGRNLELAVNWDSTGGKIVSSDRTPEQQKSQDFPYKVYVFSDPIGRAKGLEQGKEWAIKVARTRLTRALETLNGIDPVKSL